MFGYLVDIQRELHRALAGHLGDFAQNGNWWALLAVLPAGVLFGSVHALTPGHSKLVMASYLAGAPVGPLRGLLTAVVLSATHVAMSVAIVLLSVPLVRFGFGRTAGEAPILEAVSRSLLVLVGLWMVWRGFARTKHGHTHPAAFGVTAGLIPCPLTLFAMIFAIQRGVPEAGLAFAIAMLAGVTFTLSSVALATVLARARAKTILAGTRWASPLSRVLEVAFGLLLVAVSLSEIFQ